MLPGSKNIGIMELNLGHRARLTLGLYSNECRPTLATIPLVLKHWHPTLVVQNNVCSYPKIGKMCRHNRFEFGYGYTRSSIKMTLTVIVWSLVSSGRLHLRVFSDIL